MSTHTPGPWEIHNDCGTPFVYATGSKMVSVKCEDGTTVQHRDNLLALVYSVGGSEYNQEANTKLVAAAPDLLAAAKAIDAWMKETGADVYNPTGGMLGIAYAKLADAIAKAEGTA